MAVFGVLSSEINEAALNDFHAISKEFCLRVKELGSTLCAGICLGLEGSMLTRHLIFLVF